jgi:hypothetical protein
MKIKFSYFDASNFLKKIQENYVKIQCTFEMIDTTEQVRKSYSQYLLSSLDSDFYGNRFSDLDILIEKIESVEKREIKDYILHSGGFTQYISRYSVVFEHAIFGVCPHWPLWSCPLSHYKIAVEAARDFFAMPESLDTELIVELPESDMAQIALFPPKMADKEDAFDLMHD